jgi:gliding motility-associated-like protein
MKKYNLLSFYFICCCATSNVQAQTVSWNLVKNYSFEKYLDCLYFNDAIDTNTTNQRILPDWFSASILGSPDYFNRCGELINPPYGLPVNTYAYQNTYNGQENAYTGISLTGKTGGLENREYLQTKLQQRLRQNKKYCIGTKISFAYNVQINNAIYDIYKTSDLAILVSKTRPFNDKTGAPDRLIIEANPQITTNQYIDDTLNWTLLKGIVVGNGEEWLTIGNFKPEWQSSMALVYDAPGLSPPLSYYFIDDVFVIPMENDEALLHKDTTICTNGFPIQITANTGFTGYTWNNGSTGNTLVVSQEGTYTVSATYAGCTIVDTVRVKTTGVPALTLPNYAVCDNKLPFTVTLPNEVTDVFDSFAWSNNTTGATTILNTANTYTVTATMECGSTSNSFTLTTAPEPPTFTLGNDTSFCINGRPSPILLKPNFALTNYLWNTGATTPTITVSPTLGGRGVYRLSTSNACGTKTDEITIEGCPPNYYIPNTFTPNGDGKNDVFTVFASDAIVDITSMQIFDRWGEPVFNGQNIPPERGSSGQGRGWDGTFRNQAAISDVYIYIITIAFADGTTETAKGDVTLLR